MPWVRLSTIDENGNTKLIRSIRVEHGETVEVIDHASEQERKRLSDSITRRAKGAFEDLARQDPERLLKVLEQIEKESTA